jgi:flavin reductase (DIM6/NTAB) family NADH-FMN oxidoreductase RutF
MKIEFKNIIVKDNFYQSSCFFPMPLTMIGTLTEDGKTSYGSYSLIFPYYIAGKEHYAMVLECRNTSNTAKSLLRTGKCSINFIPGNKKCFQQAVNCGFPGDTPEEKMKNFKLTPIDGLRQKENPNVAFPKVLDEAIQVFECTWWKELDNAQDDKVLDDYEGYKFHNFNGITSRFGAHFILIIDKILIKEQYEKSILEKSTRKNYAPIPTNWGYRDSANFWCSKFRKPYSLVIPKKNIDIESLRYAALRLNTKVKFTDDALMVISGAPRAFLKLILKGCAEWAEQKGYSVITEKEMTEMNEERKAKKKKK